MGKEGYLVVSVGTKAEASAHTVPHRHSSRTMREPHNGQKPLQQARMGGSDQTE